MSITPHKDKLYPVLNNPKCPHEDRELLKEAITLYEEWIRRLNSLSSKGKERVAGMVKLLNWYKDEFEVELIIKRGSNFLIRQKGQLKLDNTIIEEFLVRLIHPDILNGLEDIESLEIGPQNTFMSLAFFPRSIKDLTQRPNVLIKTKAQDFVMGAKIHYKFSTKENFQKKNTAEGSLTLAVLAAECKINLDKTMFQESAGTAARLKQGCPIARYYLLAEYLDMIPEDPRLTNIDNVFLLRHVARLPFPKRNIPEEVERIHRENPIDLNVVWRFVQQIQAFLDAIWYDPKAALERGAFI